MGMAAAPPRAQRLAARSPSPSFVWALVHESGVHATIAGVALGLLTRVRPDPDESHSPAERLEHLVRPLSAGWLCPLFAPAQRWRAARPRAPRRTASSDTAAVAVVAGLVARQVRRRASGGTWLTARLTRAELSPDLGWPDIAAVAFLAGIGFTVSLLIGDLAFADDARPDGLACKTGVADRARWPARVLAPVLLRDAPAALPGTATHGHRTCTDPG